MLRSRIGRRAPKYSFMLNGHADVRLSRCPKCERLTHARKFALFVVVERWGPVVLGKTCRYCTPCELIMTHQLELEGELARCFAQRAPHVIGNEYMVLGTVDRAVWKRALTGAAPPWEEVLRSTSDFARHFDLHVDPGGWRRAP
jgi:hypothetical protein